MSQPISNPSFPAGTVEPDYRLSEALDADYAEVFSSVSEVDRAHWMRARAFVNDEVLPVIDDYWDRAEYPLHLATRLGELDLIRDGIDVPGFQPMSSLAAGLITMELSRGDGSIATIAAVQGGLALRSIALLGSDAQKSHWLKRISNCESLAAFALTEPTHGSDSVALETRAVSVDGGYLISGEKKWIGNGSVGDVTVVWARDDAGNVRGFLVPQDSEGYSATVITQKIALRAIWQAHITLDNVFVSEANVLPHARTFKDTAHVLLATRLGVAWSALGHATACFESAVHYAGQRIQFGRTLGSAQIIQERLARMLSELTCVQLLCMRMTDLDSRGSLSGPQASLAKYTATRTARSIASNARDLLGGNGILLGNRVARHFADIEAIHTYEGTETMQALIIGRSITGVSAFAS